MTKEKTILEQVIDENPSAIDVNFDLIEATLKKGIRRMKFSIDTTLKRTNRYYRITLYFNEDPYKNKIAANKRLITEIKSDVNLLDGVKGGDKDKKDKVKRLKDDNFDTLEEMSRLKSECDEFEFTGEAEKVEYDKDTLLLKIDRNTLSFLNDKAELFRHYKILLQPIV